MPAEARGADSTPAPRGRGRRGAPPPADPAGLGPLRRGGRQYPGEKESTFPPFTCLEADGEPRVLRTPRGEVVVFPLKVRAWRQAATKQLQIKHRDVLIQHSPPKLFKQEQVAWYRQQELHSIRPETFEPNTALHQARHIIKDP